MFLSVRVQLHSLSPADYYIPGCHTNNVENSRRWAKNYVKQRINVTDDVVLQKQLRCYMWHLWRGRLHPVGKFERILEDISIIYPL